MKITSCFIKLAEIEPLVKAGADELYCAVAPLPSFCDGALPDMKTLKAAVRRTHALGKKLSVAVNSVSHVYPAAAQGRLLDLLLQADACGVDAFIAANPFLPPLAAAPGVSLKARVHLSSAQPCFNTEAAGFFIRRGISRLILSTQLSPFEARGILRDCRAAGVETEIFDHRFCGCTYVNGRCALHHPDFHTLRPGGACGAPCRQGTPAAAGPEGAAGRPAAALLRRLAARIAAPPVMYTHASFFDFFLAGADYLKYGVRLDPPEMKARKVADMRAMIDLAGNLCGSLGKDRARKTFLKRMEAWTGPGGGRK